MHVCVCPYAWMCVCVCACACVCVCALCVCYAIVHHSSLIVDHIHLPIVHLFTQGMSVEQFIASLVSVVQCSAVHSLLGDGRVGTE